MFFSLVGLSCAALSVVTWVLFRPQAPFHAPPGKTATFLFYVLILGMGISSVLSLAGQLPLWLGVTDFKNLPSIFTGLFLMATYGRAIWHHIEHASRTPRDLWDGFFGIR